MDRFRIQGGATLNGSVKNNGAKNAALPQMAASLLTSEPLILDNVPDLQDIRSMILLLINLGASVRKDGDTLEIDASRLNSVEAPYDLVRKMRASIVCLGPLMARAGEARVSLPGGCAIGARPVDLHINAIRRMGADIAIEKGYIHALARNGLKGGEIVFEKVTVTGTENAMMAAVLAKGKTILQNCAMEPEVVDLAAMLIKMGAQIEGHATPTITIEGVGKLNGTRHSIIPDRIEAGTYLVAGLITGGEITLENCRPDIMTSTIQKLQDCGGNLEIGKNFIKTLPGNLTAADTTTMPYPGFPTDMQAQLMTLLTQCEGSSVVTETIFENRFMHVPELVRMGADIKADGNIAIIKGTSILSGASVMATDLRASASLVLAGLVAEGETVVNRVYHIDRGYSHIVSNLNSLGAEIERIV